MQNVAWWKRKTALARRRRLRVAIEATHVPRRVVCPALAADIGIKMCIAVGDDIEARHFLLMQVDRDRIDILLAELVIHHRI